VSGDGEYSCQGDFGGPIFDRKGRGQKVSVLGCLATVNIVAKATPAVPFSIGKHEVRRTGSMRRFVPPVGAD
jgi:hypothetical protein